MSKGQESLSKQVRRPLYVNSAAVQSDEELCQAVRDSMKARLISTRNLLRMYEAVFSGQHWRQLAMAIDEALEPAEVDAASEPREAVAA